MKTFTLKADATFTAKNLDDAFEQLSQHFQSLRSLEWDSSLEFTGTLSVTQAEEALDIGPEFVKEIEKFSLDLAARQESLGDPFGKILQENLWDLYSTSEKV